MEVIYNLEQFPYGKTSIFLAGPTPRSNKVESWRPSALEEFSSRLQNKKYGSPWELSKSFDDKIAIIVPEGRDGGWHGHYYAQCEWEHHCIERCSVLMFWVPRVLPALPGFTTNVEFGLFLQKDNVVYGRPTNAPKTSYLDWLFYKSRGAFPLETLSDVVEESLRRATRTQPLLQGP